MPQNQISLTHNDTMSILDKHDTTAMDQMTVGEINAYIKLRRKKESFEKATQLAKLEKKVAGFNDFTMKIHNLAYGSEFNDPDIVSAMDLEAVYQKMCGTIFELKKENMEMDIAQRKFKKEVVDALQCDDDFMDHEIISFIEDMESEHDPAMMDELKKENQKLKNDLEGAGMCSALMDQLKSINDDLRKDNIELNAKLVKIEGDNVGPDTDEEIDFTGYSFIVSHGTRYTICPDNNVYQGGEMREEVPSNVVGKWQTPRLPQMDPDVNLRDVEHNGQKGYILWNEGHPIKTCQINPSMNGMSS